MISLSTQAAGQESTRSLTGRLNLDVAPAVRDLNLELRVRNHTFVVLPPPLGFVRPITSTASVSLAIPLGVESVPYQVSGIELDPVDYSIEILCDGCKSVLPRQYYGNPVNSLSLLASSYIKPDDLPQTLNITAITHATVAGDIVLLEPSERDLEFELRAVDASQIEATRSGTVRRVLGAGAARVAYSISGIRRGNTALTLKWQCVNCQTSARRARILDAQLVSDQNHSGIDLILESEGVPVVSPALLLLE